MSLQLNGTAGVTYNDGSNQPAAASPYGLKNLIINGDMRIDQRNAGASVSMTSSVVAYPVDRFYFYYQMGASSVTTQRVSDAPTDFEYSSKITVGTGDTATASEAAIFRQLLEGNNVSHLKCGTANAKTTTLSFWVKSSVTGSYGIGIRNSAFNRSYVMTYTISSANTWEKKTLTFTNDTTGTWLKDNGIGLTITWDLGSGSDFHTATTETWGAGNLFTTSSQANVIGTSGATWQITGVQLEIGDTATPFENRMYGTELALCQRYFETSFAYGQAVPTSTFDGMVAPGYNQASSTTGEIGGQVNFQTKKRAAPTVTIYDQSSNSGKLCRTLIGVGNYDNQTASIANFNDRGGLVYGSGNNASYVRFHFKAEAEL